MQELEIDLTLAITYAAAGEFVQLRVHDHEEYRLAWAEVQRLLGVMKIKAHFDRELLLVSLYNGGFIQFIVQKAAYLKLVVNNDAQG